MADEPVAELNGKTPLEVAHKPVMDYMATYGELGLVKTVPDGISPGSDAASRLVGGHLGAFPLVISRGPLVR